MSAKKKLLGMRQLRETDAEKTHRYAGDYWQIVLVNHLIKSLVLKFSI